MVSNPEELSAVWEAPDGHGGAVGLHLRLHTSAPNTGTTLVGTKQTWLNLDVGLYHRAGSELQFDEQGGFSDSPRGGSARYENGRLTLHHPEFDLDLTRIPGDKWAGRFHRMQFDAQEVSPKSAWLVGTWRTGTEQFQTCLHIVEQSPGVFVGWSDQIQTPGPSLYSLPPQIEEPRYFSEYFGELAKIHLIEEGKASVELGAYAILCCSQRSIATPAENGTVLRTISPARSPHQTPYMSEWRKMPGDTCIVPGP